MKVNTATPNFDYLELSDTTSEQFSGGGIMTPEAKGGHNGTGGNNSTTGGPIANSMIPFYPALPPRKLPGLGPLGRSSRTSSVKRSIPIPPKPYET
jgi:hypothetical protein